VSVEVREIEVTEEWIKQAWGLFEAHREELTTNKALMVLNPDVSTYVSLQKNGSLLALAAFDGDEQVGYSINIIVRNLHYADVLMCQNDVIFVRDDKRRGTTGLRLLRETERLAQARGADVMLWHAKPKTNLADVLQRLEYGIQDIVYMRAL